MMTNTKLFLLTTTTLAVLATPAILLADDDEGEEREHHGREHGERGERGEHHGRERGGERSATGATAPRTAALQASPAFAEYREECGSCHLAYPPGLLPARSWQRLLDGLADHFGQNAELDAAARARLGAWLTANAAESGSHPMSGRVLRSAAGSAPLRISELGFVSHEHGEVAAEVWTRPAVKSVANCAACHTDAERWNFGEHGVRIPAR